MINYFWIGVAVTAGVLAVVFVVVFIVGAFDKVRELWSIARALRKRGK